MLYLEDYVELIEHLPTDLRERFTDMREMDLQVQNRTESLNEKVKNLFQKCSLKKSEINGADQIFDEIRNEYYKVLDDADEKVQLANQIYDLVDRHLRKLDQELSKFKMELEADNAGITEVLEQRSLELDNPVSLQKGSGRERRKAVFAVSQSSSSSSSSLVSLTTNNGEGPLPEKRIKLQPNSESETFTYLQQATDNSNFLNYTENSFRPLIVESDSTVSQQSVLSDPLDFTEDEPPSIETKPVLDRESHEQERSLSSTTLSLDIRRTFSVKESYESLLPSEIISSKTNEFERINVDSLDTSGEIVSDSSMSSMPGIMIHRPSRTKKQTSKAAAWEQERMQAEARHEQRRKENQPSTSSIGENPEEHSGVEIVGDNTSNVEWNYDPNEPRYCLCNQVSYGEMVGCDNDKCPIEWFHYGCVELTEAPKGKWYCPQCTQTMKRRNKR